MHPKIYSFGARLDREGRWKPPSCSIGTKYAFTSLCRSRIDFSISSVVLGVGGGSACVVFVQSTIVVMQGLVIHRNVLSGTGEGYWDSGGLLLVMFRKNNLFARNDGTS